MSLRFCMSKIYYRSFSLDLYFNLNPSKQYYLKRLIVHHKLKRFGAFDTVNKLMKFVIINMYLILSETQIIKH